MRWLGWFLTGGVLLAAVALLAPLAHGDETRSRVLVHLQPVPQPDGRLALQIRWRWQGRPSLLRRWPLLTWVGCRCLEVDPDDLLAVTFDTRFWAYVGDDAPFGRGAYGRPLRRLEAARGPDGARRLYFIPPGVDGQLTVLFAPTAGHPPPAGFMVDFVHDYGGDGWVVTETVEAPGEGAHLAGAE